MEHQSADSKGLSTFAVLAKVQFYGIGGCIDASTRLALPDF